MKDRLISFFSRFANKFSIPTEGKKYYFLLVFLLLTSFLVSSICLFPINAFKGSLERELARNLNTDVAIGSLTLEFPLKVRANHIRATLPTPVPHVLNLKSLLLSPQWSAFLSGGSALAFSGSLNGGSFDGEMNGKGDLALNLRDVRFSIPLDTKETLLLGGVAREGHLSGVLSPKGKKEAQVVLNADNLEVAGVRILGLKEDTLALGQLSLQGNGDGRTLRLKQLTLREGAVTGEGSGTVVLKNPLSLSTLRLTAVLRTDPGAGEISTLLSLLKQPAADGSFRIRLLGTLQAPLVR